MVRRAGSEQIFAVAGGVAEVQPDLITVLADAAENVEEIDVKRAEALGLLVGDADDAGAAIDDVSLHATDGIEKSRLAFLNAELPAPGYDEEGFEALGAGAARQTLSAFFDELTDQNAKTKAAFTAFWEAFFEDPNVSAKTKATLRTQVDAWLAEGSKEMTPQERSDWLTRGLSLGKGTGASIIDGMDSKDPLRVALAAAAKSAQTEEKTILRHGGSFGGKFGKAIVNGVVWYIDKYGKKRIAGAVRGALPTITWKPGGTKPVVVAAPPNPDPVSPPKPGPIPQSLLPKGVMSTKGVTSTKSVTVVYAPTYSTASVAEAQRFATAITPELVREMRRQGMAV